MILLPRIPAAGGVAARLVAALAARGIPSETCAPGPLRAGDLLLAPAAGEPACDLPHWLESHPPRPDTRLMVLSRLGSHPDARAASLVALWELEEAARRSGLATLVLRLAPLLGPESPLWRRLRAQPGLARGGRGLLNPVAEVDVLETAARALDGRAAWTGWYEVAGPDTFTLAELRDLARQAAPPLPAGSGAWEPPLEEMGEHRLAEAGPWLAHFGLTPTPIRDAVLGSSGARAST